MFFSHCSIAFELISQTILSIISAPIGYMIVVYIKGLWCMVFSVYTLLQKFVYHAGAQHGGHSKNMGFALLKESWTL